MFHTATKTYTKISGKAERQLATADVGRAWLYLLCLRPRAGTSNEPPGRQSLLPVDLRRPQDDRGARRNFTVATEPRRAPARQRNAGARAGRALVAERQVSDELGKNAKKLSDADCDKSSIVWAPDSKSLLWPRSDRKLRRVEVESGKEDVLATAETGSVSGPQFSPDGKWISYAKQGALLRSNVWIKEPATGQEHKMSYLSRVRRRMTTFASGRFAGMGEERFPFWEQVA